MLFHQNNNRNHSLFSKRTTDGHFRRFTQNPPTHLKMSNSKTLFEVCPTDRSQSEANQTSNNLLGYSQDIIQSPRTTQFHIKTYIRFKPARNLPLSELHADPSMKKIAIIDKKKILCEDNFFTYDNVFEEDSKQKDIYNCVCKQMVEHFVRGFNSTIFAYGQTGSGKTFTMFGEIQQEQQKGIVPQVIRDIFEFIGTVKNTEKNQQTQIIVSCSMLEIYKESMIDLLSSEKLDLKIKQHQIFNVSNLSIKPVNTEQQMCEVLRIGNESKKIRETNMNEASSRSHVIFTIYLQIRKQNERRLSKFNLVDLAGSEKVSKSKVEGEGLEQAKKINLSLSCLGNTINALLKGNDHIPYRESKLTRLLYESLGGNSLTRLIVTCSSEDSEIEQTLSSLKFASRAKNLKTNPLINTLRKSQKSVSRIAFENLKTNLNKSENKLKKIQNVVDEVMIWMGQDKKILSQNKDENKENSSFLSNKQSQQKNFNIKNNETTQLQGYRKFFIKINQILSSQSKDNIIDEVYKPRKNQYLSTETFLNPFLMITENEQKNLVHEKSQKKVKMIENKRSVPNICQISSNHKQNQKYWQIIKQQQKQIQFFKKKLKLFEQRNQIINSQSNNNMKQLGLCEKSDGESSLKNYQKHEQQKIDDKKVKKLLNVQLGKGLTVKEIFLNSPSYKTTDFSKKTIHVNSKSLSRKNSDENIFNQKVQSPREFNTIQMPQNEDNKIFELLKEICKRLNNKNEYQKFQKRIMTRQIDLLLQQLHQNNQNTQNSSEQKTILTRQTHQLLTFQSKYIDQLQNVLLNLKQRRMQSNDEGGQKDREEMKHKINAIKFR